MSPLSKSELDRLITIDERIQQIFKDNGHEIVEVDFEIAPAAKVIEGSSYMFPTNFSHWTFGRDYDRTRTIYEHSGFGIPYEQVWNFEQRPKALLVETNPFVLHVLILAHVYGHVNFFRTNPYCIQGRKFADVAEEARRAAKTFAEYEQRYGAEVEYLIDYGMSIMWHQNPDPFYEEVNEDELRDHLLEIERTKLKRARGFYAEFKKAETQEEIQKSEKKLQMLGQKTPPRPEYDLLGYIINHSRALKPWMKDVLSVIRNQARCLLPNGRTKMLNEGWATYQHVNVARQLFKEGLLTPEEHGTFNTFHSGVVARHRKSFNPYTIGLALYEHIKERWDRGQFGKDFEESNDPYKWEAWNTHADLGDWKINQVKSAYSDVLAAREFFTDAFIREQELYIWGEMEDKYNGEVYDVIVEDDPKIVRNYLIHLLTNHSPQIVITDGNFGGKNELFMEHIMTGYELDPLYRDMVLKRVAALWGGKVYLSAVSEDKLSTFSVDPFARKKK